ncbi:glycosyl hydrolase 115 family protein [Chitinophaga sancti]|uniref:glycosyl hydrolase 115 family protein n=1 Tax=Chitinophaga sancti TaxID=1004 RepID=UPI002A74FDF3|nr:glycosyl hydrolase 115 family protein [Chitinophaga sancti]WPQ60554.1 glycosyl hydrolase 115 family protein [Chitinophaga sancti]
MKNCIPLLILLCHVTITHAQVHARQIITTRASQHTFALPEVIYVDQQDDWLVNKAAELLRADMLAVTGRAPEIVHRLDGRPYILIGIVGRGLGKDSVGWGDGLDTVRVRGKWKGVRRDEVAALDTAGLGGKSEAIQKDVFSGLDTTGLGGKSETIQRNVFSGLDTAGLGGKSETIQRDMFSGLDTTGLNGKWEAFRITVSPGKVIILGSDKRGAAYGALELSKQLGVSPWYWWADVPIKKKEKVFVQEGRYDFGPPSVQYRGIFINDEAPAFSGWTHEKFGGFNHHVYEKIFELLLRLRGNYLWPAMWGNAFNDDDRLNPVLADKWGIVMGTSHHEPMLRAQAEWKRYGRGAWDYVANDSVLRAFWREGIVAMAKHESIVTIGMRGDGDLPMSSETATDLLERIVRDQRSIISEVTGKPAAETPQLWALYKEVQDYYDRGMRVPDDVTLLLCDDNWGNIRRFPDPLMPKRKGGYGVYYHFDYVGDPRNYKWVNTNNLARVWEQLHLAKMYGVDKIWIVNVGDLKPMELPIAFFMDYAWRAEPGDTLPDYYKQFAEENFGEGSDEWMAEGNASGGMEEGNRTSADSSKHSGFSFMNSARNIGDYLRQYSEMAARRKPELLDESSYTLKQYKEIVGEWEELVKKVRLQPYSDAYFELVQFPVEAMYNLHRLYYAVALYKSNRVQNKAWADSARKYYMRDSLLTVVYHQVAGGKWNHMMDQTHIGYTGWQQPPVNKMPDLTGPYTPPVVPKIYKQISATGYVSKYGDWVHIKGIGKFGDGITSFANSGTFSDSIIYHSAGAVARYEFEASGNTNIYLNFSPTLNFTHGDGLWFGVSIDGAKELATTINAHDDNKELWSKWVSDNVIQVKLSYSLKPGKHEIVYSQYSPGIVLQSIEFEKH